MEYRYKEERSEITGVIYRPVADIFVQSKKGKWIELHPYIDSGADITLIPLSLGEYLGFEIDKSEIKELRGVGGEPVPVMLVTAHLKIGECELDARIAWALTEEVPPLLGRLDIFERFRVIFDEKEKKIIFRYRE